MNKENIPSQEEIEKFLWEHSPSKYARKDFFKQLEEKIYKKFIYKKKFHSSLWNYGGIIFGAIGIFLITNNIFSEKTKIPHAPELLNISSFSQNKDMSMWTSEISPISEEKIQSKKLQTQTKQIPQEEYTAFSARSITTHEEWIRADLETASINTHLDQKNIPGYFFLKEEWGYFLYSPENKVPIEKNFLNKEIEKIILHLGLSIYESNEQKISEKKIILIYKVNEKENPIQILYDNEDKYIKEIKIPSF